MRDTVTYQSSRKIGFEIEFSGLSLRDTADIIQRHFGGTIQSETDVVCLVSDSVVGDFRLEIDALSVQKIAEATRKFSKTNNSGLVKEVVASVGKVTETIAALVVPFEIVSPPIPMYHFSKMEAMRADLQRAGATDTKDSIYAAYGLHLNPEVQCFESIYILRHLQAFSLLSSYLVRLHCVDFSRRLTNFIDPFPAAWHDLILGSSYCPDMQELIKDYHEYNPTRNRALDMLPFFAYVNAELVRLLYGTEHKINKRPTFHYRLPNCELADPSWTFATEWQRWRLVEIVAGDEHLRQRLVSEWRSTRNDNLTDEVVWAERVELLLKDAGLA